MLYTIIVNGLINYDAEGSIDGNVKIKNLRINFQAIDLKFADGNDLATGFSKKNISTKVYKLFPNCYIHSIAPHL